MMYDRVILGKNCVYSTNSDETKLNNNVIVCGTSGAGKTMSIAEPRLLETKNSSLIMTLSKRKLVPKYTWVFEDRGYNVWDLNFINPEKSNVSYDPLHYVKDYQDITFLARAIVCSQEGESFNRDPYWDESAISLLCAEIEYILMTQKAPSFVDVLELHESIEIIEGRKLIKTSIDDKFKQLERNAPNSSAVTCWKSFRQLPATTASCVFGTLNTAIATIFTPELRKMIRMNRNIDFSKLANEKTILFVTTSAVNLSLNRFVNMFYAQVFKELFEYAEKRTDGVLPIPVHVFADDFAVGSVIHNFPQFISIFREKRISVTLLLQSESQLESMYGNCNATTIINNCDTYIYMGGMDLRTATSISQRINIPLDEVLYMPVGKEVIIRRGAKPIITDRYDITEDELYQEIVKKYEELYVEKVEEHRSEKWSNPFFVENLAVIDDIVSKQMNDERKVKRMAEDIESGKRSLEELSIEELEKLNTWFEKEIEAKKEMLNKL